MGGECEHVRYLFAILEGIINGVDLVLRPGQNCVASNTVQTSTRKMEFWAVLNAQRPRNGDPCPAH